MTGDTRDPLGAGPDGGAGGVAVAAANKLEPFSDALEELLERKRGLNYVRRDGYVLLGELLSSSDARSAVEALAPGCWVAADPHDPIHPVLLDAVRRVAQGTLAADGQPCFEFWDDDGGWIRAVVRRDRHGEDTVTQASGGAAPASNVDGKGLETQDEAEGAAEAQSSPREPDCQVQKMESGPSPLLRRCTGLREDCADAAAADPGAASPRAPEAVASADGTGHAELTTASPPAGQGAGGRISLLPAWVLRQQEGTRSHETTDSRLADSSGPRTGLQPLRSPPLSEDLRGRGGPWGGCGMEATPLEVSSRSKKAPSRERAANKSRKPVATELWLSAESDASAAAGPDKPRGAKTNKISAQPEDSSSTAKASAKAGSPRPAPRKRYVGELKCFYTEKNFGFISSKDFETDIYAHARSFRDVNPEGCVDVEVEFELDERCPAARPRARVVRALGESSGPSGASKGGRERILGRLRAFFPEKGFGFIAPGDGSPDAFVHASSVVGRQPQACTGMPDSSPTGEEVEFSIDFRRPDRPRAVCVRVVGEALGQAESVQEEGRPAGRQWGEPRLLEEALVEVLRRKDGLQYVRKDGYALLSEALATPQVQAALEAVLPGVVVAPGAPLPERVLEALRATRLEVWEGDPDGGWIRAPPEAAQEPRKEARPPKVEVIEEGEADGAEWWMGSAPPQPAAGAKRRQPEGNDPWGNSADPWSQSIRAAGDCEAEAAEVETAAEGAEEAAEADDHVEARPPETETHEEGNISGCAAIREVLRILPKDAPRGVRAYLETWARLESV